MKNRENMKNSGREIERKEGGGVVQFRIKGAIYHTASVHVVRVI